MPKLTAQRLTDSKIASEAKAPAGKRKEIPDQERGLVLRVNDAGVKTFSVVYRCNGKRGRQTLGEWPDQISLEEARAAAREIRNKARAGKDPKKDDCAECVTFGDLAKQYMNRGTGDLARADEIKSLIRRELIPEIGTVALTEVRRRNLVRAIEAIKADGKKAKAHRVGEIGKRITRWAVETDELAADPFAGLSLTKIVARAPRQRVLDDDEIKKVWDAAAAAAYPLGPFVQLLMLLGQRRDEVGRAQWSEFDLEKKAWTIPPERYKSDKVHIVPLPDAAVDILEALPRLKGPFLFSTTDGTKPISGYSKFKVRLDKLSGVSDWRLHDLRRTVRTRLSSLGVVDVVSERIIGHGPRGLAAVYDQYAYADEKRQGLERWAAALDHIVDPPPDNVVKLRA